jgi:hypothetical protein
VQLPGAIAKHEIEMSRASARSTSSPDAFSTKLSRRHQPESIQMTINPSRPVISAGGQQGVVKSNPGQRFGAFIP